MAKGKIEAQLSLRAERLIAKHIHIQTLLENVHEETDLEHLSKGLMSDYKQIEDEFLLLAFKLQTQHFSFFYNKTPFLIRCCPDFEEVQIDHLVALEAA